jgi:hypothetical protein
MKALLTLSCLLTVGAAGSFASPHTTIPFFHHHKKAAVTDTTEAKPKTKRSFLHRAQPTREEEARSEATYGMPGPSSVGHWHPEPGPAGVGAK